MKKKTVITAGSLLLFIFLWMLFVDIIGNPLLMPSLSDVFRQMIMILSSWNSLLVILHSLWRLMIAVLLSLAAGVILGVLAGIVPEFSWFVKPHVTILRTIPVISIIVILLVIFGFRVAPYVITFLMVFPLMYQASYEGIRHMDESIRDVYRLETPNLYLSIKDLYIPMIAPYVGLSLLQSFGLGLKVLVMAEYLSQTQKSIGNALYLAKVNLEYDRVFAWSILLILMSLVFEHIFRTYQNRKS